MKIVIYNDARRVAMAIESLKAGICEKRNITDIGIFYVCPKSLLRIHTENGHILLTEKIGQDPIARIHSNQPFNYAISHPGMADYINQIPIPKSVTSVA